MMAHGPLPFAPGAATGRRWPPASNAAPAGLPRFVAPENTQIQSGKAGEIPSQPDGYATRPVQGQYRDSP